MVSDRPLQQRDDVGGAPGATRRRAHLVPDGLALADVARGAPAPDQDLAAAPAFWRQQLVQKRDRWEEARLDELTDGLSRMEFMLRFTLSHPDIHTIIVGTANPEHLASNVHAASRDALPPDVYAEACGRLDTLH